MTPLQRTIIMDLVHTVRDVHYHQAERMNELIRLLTKVLAEKEDKS